MREGVRGAGKSGGLVFRDPQASHPALAGGLLPPPTAAENSTDWGDGLPKCWVSGRTPGCLLGGAGSAQITMQSDSPPAWLKGSIPWALWVHGVPGLYLAAAGVVVNDLSSDGVVHVG